MTPRRRAPTVHLGVDFGSTGLRAAFAPPGRTAEQLHTAPGHPWLVCEPLPFGPVPVGFPGFKTLLGGSARRVREAGVVRTPDELVSRALRNLREQVEAVAPGPVGQTVISVPARYGSAQRAALLAAARSAGFGRVGLINDSSAAVIGHTADQDSGICLVYGMGYEGCELGLVRAAGGAYRVLGHEGVETSGGRVFDADMLAAFVQVWRSEPGAEAAVPADESGWRRLRAQVEKVRELLGSAARNEEVVLEPRTVIRRSGRGGFDAYLDRHLDRTLRHADTLLEQAGFGRAEVDTVLLTGGCTRLERIASGVRDWFGRPCTATPPGLLALGALRHAARLGSSTDGHEDSAPALDVLSHDTLGDAPRLTAALLAAPGTPLDVDAARRLAAQGRTGQARDLLHRIVDEARSLLDELGAGPDEEATPGERTGIAVHDPAAPAERPDVTAAVPLPVPAAAPAPASHPLMAEARRLLGGGSHEQAVRASHTAWQLASTGPDGAGLLDAMIDVHCAAAMADTAVEHFDDADRWLRCAYGHDPTNTRVRGLLAERTYQHAVELHRLGRRDDAAQALSTCLGWDPEHTGAEKLLRSLGRARHSPYGAAETPG